MITKQNKVYKNLSDFREIWKCVSKMGVLGIELKLVWVPGHAEIEGNEMADVAA